MGYIVTTCAKASTKQGRRLLRGEETKMDTTGNNYTGVQDRGTHCALSEAPWCHNSQSTDFMQA